MLTMAGRRTASPECAPPLASPDDPPRSPAADLSSASRCIGTPFGVVIVAAVPGAKLSPVITPPALTVTSAVACCHHGRRAESTAIVLLLPALDVVSCAYWPEARPRRIAWTREFPGLFALV